MSANWPRLAEAERGCTRLDEAGRGWTRPEAALRLTWRWLVGWRAKWPKPLGGCFPHRDPPERHAARDRLLDGLAQRQPRIRPIEHEAQHLGEGRGDAFWLALRRSRSLHAPRSRCIHRWAVPAIGYLAGEQQDVERQRAGIVVARGRVGHTVVGCVRVHDGDHKAHGRNRVEQACSARTLQLDLAWTLLEQAPKARGGLDEHRAARAHPHLSAVGRGSDEHHVCVHHHVGGSERRGSRGAYERLEVLGDRGALCLGQVLRALEERVQSGRVHAPGVASSAEL
eukprot:scaffold32637_cov61-Phaeocystis_antarctica.AAC.2